MAMGNNRVEIVVGVQDLASRALGNISRSVSNMSRDMNRVGSIFGSLNRTLDTSIAKLDKMANSMYKFNMYTSDLQRNIKNIGLIGGAVAGGIAYHGIQNTLDFDYKTHTMQSRMMGSNDVRRQIEDYILKDLNLKVGYSPNQIADLGIVMSQAGVSNVPDMKKMLENTTYFSEAVGGIPDQMGEMMISAIKGWNLSMDDSSEVADKLTLALNNSLIHVEELPHAIGQLAGRANLYGQSLDSALVALMSARNQGLPSAQAAQNMLHGLSQASRAGNDEVLYKRTKGYFDSLGIDHGIFDKDTRKLKEFPELIADIEKAMIKQGFTNNKYGIKTHEDFQKYIKDNGTLPDDIWDSMSAAPLLTKVFGKAGIAPILMGMQTKWEEVDRNTGEKTGEVYYGSEALKRMYDMIKNSQGATKETHAIIEDSAKFQLNVLSGAWQAVQENFMRNLLPVLKTSAKELTSWILPTDNTKFNNFGPQIDEGHVKKLSGLEKFDLAIKESAENFRKEGHGTVADTLELLGDKAINGIKIGSTMPPMVNQITESFNENIIGAEWGSNIIEFPIHLVKNGIKFINDLASSSEEFKAAVEKLPTDLQDPAKLIETLAKGGIILLVTGAIVKVIELGVRGVSTVLKGAKLGVELAQSIGNWLKGVSANGGNNPASSLNKNMNIKANIVNVYGPGGAGGTGNTPGGVVTTTGGSGAGSKWGKFFKGAGLFGAGLIAYDIYSGVTGGNSVIKDGLELAGNKALGTKSEKQIEEIHEIIKNPAKHIPKDTELAPYTPQFEDKVKDLFTPKVEKSPAVFKLPEVKIQALDKFDQMLININNNAKNKTEQNMKKQEDFINNHSQLISDFRENSSLISSHIMEGFNSANQKLQNIKLNNQVSVQMPPAQITINGNIKEHINSVSVSGTNTKSVIDNGPNIGLTASRTLMARRLGW